MRPPVLKEVMSDLQKGVAMLYELKIPSWYETQDRYVKFLFSKWARLLTTPKSLDRKPTPIVSVPLRAETGWRPVRKKVD